MSKQVCEVNFNDSNWMIAVGMAARRADRIIVKDFRPTAQNMGFLKLISNENRLLLNASEDGKLMLDRVHPNVAAAG